METNKHKSFLVVGLGNPGQKYQNTWHNLGFIVIDGFAQKNNFPGFENDKWSRSLVSKKDLADRLVILSKPQVFMNASGLSVTNLFKNYKLKADNLIVVHDDADLAVAQIRISEKRGTAGHKGVESIVAALKTKGFVRVRIGCRPKNYVPGSKTLANFVLRKPARNDRQVLENTVGKAVNALEMILKEGAARTMNEYNK